MKNLNIRIKILSPIILPNYNIHLDALLFASLNEDLDLLKEILFCNEDGIFSASAMRFLQSPINTIQHKVVAMPTTTKWHDFDYPILVRGKPMINHSITTKTGDFRKKITKHNAINVPFVDFYAKGHPDKIQFLLENIGFIGKGNNSGYGQIGEIEITEIDEDRSFFDENNNLLRILPLSYYDTIKPSDNKYLVEKARFRPNYTSSEIVPCVIPDFNLLTLNIHN